MDSPQGSNGTTQLRIDLDNYIPRLFKLCESVHKHGACIAIQINHAGASAMSSRIGMQPVSASDVPSKAGGEIPRPLEKEEILHIVKKYGDGIMCIFPSDHFIKNEPEFTRVLKEAIQIAEEQDKLITLGITPTFPSTGYGYIKFDAADEGYAKKVVEFKEKPDEETAKAYVESGEYAWNSGMFIWRASTILRAFDALLPDVAACLHEIGEAMGTDAEAETIARVYPTTVSYTHLTLPTICSV